MTSKISNAGTALQQIQLMMTYRMMTSREHSTLSFRDVGFRCHSQNEEDGILLYIFSLIDVADGTCVEICAGDGLECNTTNLIVNHRWHGLLCDGNSANTARARNYFVQHPDTKYWPPIIVNTWVTRESINQILDVNGFNGTIDLFSLDIDGMDYWVWDALNCVRPRVVVVEFNHLWGPGPSVTVPYDADFKAEFTEYGTDYAGASLAAFVKLGRSKGYRLVGTNAIATNAFFVRADIACPYLLEIDPVTCFDHPRARFGMASRLPNVKNKDWETV